MCPCGWQNPAAIPFLPKSSQQMQQEQLFQQQQEQQRLALQHQLEQQQIQQQMQRMQQQQPPQQLPLTQLDQQAPRPAGLWTGTYHCSPTSEALTQVDSLSQPLSQTQLDQQSQQDAMMQAQANAASLQASQQSQGPAQEDEYQGWGEPSQDAARQTQEEEEAQTADTLNFSLETPDGQEETDNLSVLSSEFSSASRKPRSVSSSLHAFGRSRRKHSTAAQRRAEAAAPYGRTAVEAAQAGGAADFPVQPPPSASE